VPGPAGPAPRRGPKLTRPTAKLTAALAGVALGAVLLGNVLGLPTPFAGSGADVASLNAQGLPLDSGIAAGLYRGPFHPVLGHYGYGEGGAKFGADRGGRRHEGQDVFAKRGTPVIAVHGGVVIERNGGGGHDYGGGGNYVTIYSPIENRSYVYLHMLKPALVGIGERVRAGQKVGQVGCTGSCSGDHLHFEIRIGKAYWGADTRAIDPLPYLREWPQAKPN
jgi:murein DD-endopeptidase MepM/ murein hydrolase activator NlpD